MKFSVIHPTARVDLTFGEYAWWHAAESVLRTSDSDPRDMEYILVVHFKRLDLLWTFMEHARPYFGRFTVVVNTGRDCLVDQCNAGLLAAQGEIHCWNQDDMRYPEHWDSEILKLIPDTRRKVCVQARTDGSRRDLLTLPAILTRTLADEIGPLCPEYDGMFSDDEFSAKARALCDGGIVASNLYFQHLHPAYGTGKGDAVHAMENRGEAYKTGKDVFERRRALGFPRVDLPGFERKVPKIQPVIAICTPGETHSNLWNRERDRLLWWLLSEGWAIRTYWDYTTNVYHTRMGITRDLAKDSETEGREPDLVLWIDDDNVPSWSAVRCLIETLGAHPEYAGAAGWCWIKFRQDGKPAWMPSVGNFKPGTMYLLPTLLPDLYADNASPKRIEWSGFPTILMRYSAVKELGMKAFQPIFCEENEFGFSGEDTAFFARAMEAGVKFCVDPRAKVEHLKLQPIEPDYRIGPQADALTAAMVEKGRERLNGARVEVSEDVRKLVEAAM